MKNLKSNPVSLPLPPCSKTLYKGFEGGEVCTSEQDGKFLVIIDESALADILPDEFEGMELTRVIEFTSESERSAYLLKRFGPKS